MNNKAKEPLLHIEKRDELPLHKAWGIRLIAILLALILCAVITALVTGLNPLKVYGTMFQGAFGSARKSWVTFQRVAILLGISLAVTPAFKMRFWNIGAEGQVLAGSIASAACMICLADKMPNAALLAVIVIAGIVAGAIWGLIPAIFKAQWNTNETLFTLMMNYVATQIAAFLIIKWEHPKGSGTIGIINLTNRIGWMPKLGGNDYLLDVLVAVVLTVIVYIYLKYSKHGYEIAVVGESERTAKYIGINVKKVIIRTMLFSGAICGLIGAILVSSTNHTLTTSLVGGQGFTAVMVSWMANFNPITMLFASILIIFFDRGANEISTVFGLDQAFADILIGVVIFFLIGCEFFVRYKVSLRKSSKKEVAENA